MLDREKLFLGIDTSNYTTSAAICDGEGRIVANLKRLLPVAEGERGLRQSDALFAHSKNLPIIMNELNSFLDESYPEREIVTVGYSATPRDVEGSYMPCFLAGVASAASVRAVTGSISYAFSHQAGHIAAAVCTAGREELLNERFLAFHVSGGTTDLLLCDKLNITQIGGTLDLNAGQAIDRCGVALGLSFPCGAEMDTLSKNSVGENLDKS